VDNRPNLLGRKVRTRSRSFVAKVAGNARLERSKRCEQKRPKPKG